MEHLYSRQRGTANPDVWLEQHFLGPHVDDPAAPIPAPGVLADLAIKGDQRQWALHDLRQSKRDLVIGDRPLFVEGKLGGEHLLVMPIAPKCVWLAFDNPQTGANVQQQNDDHFARMINKAMVMQADRYVYSTGMQHESGVRKYLRNRGLMESS